MLIIMNLIGLVYSGLFYRIDWLTFAIKSSFMNCSHLFPILLGVLYTGALLLVFSMFSKPYSRIVELCVLNFVSYVHVLFSLALHILQSYIVDTV